MATSANAAADYRREDMTGKRFRRACRIIITNPYGGAGGYVHFDEEQIVEMNGAVKATPMATLNMPVNLDAAIALFDPSTGAAIPGATMTQLQVYVALYSVYRALAAQRDAAEAPPILPVLP